nr:patatin-like phospholipase family protein [Paracidobacterium acidisoli]
MASRTPPPPETQPPPYDPDSWSPDKGDVYDYAARQSLLGLCFSGGGIRSATFNLGILQALAELNLLPHFDYLSTVSGGGYIHQWLAAWIKRSSDLEHVRKQLVPQPEDNCTPASAEPIRWLRRYASYLTPRRGLFSADLWVIVAVWFRNTLLNQIVLFTVLGMIFALPHLLTMGFQPGKTAVILPISSTGLNTFFYAGNAAACLIFLFVIWRMAGNFRRMRNTPPATQDEPKLLTNDAVRRQLIVPLLACAVWLNCWLETDRFAQDGFFSRNWLTWVVIGVLFSIAAIWLAFAGGCLDCLHLRLPRHLKWKERRRLFTILVATFLIVPACLLSAGAATLLVPLLCKVSHWISCLLPLIPPPQSSHARWLCCFPKSIPLILDPWRVKLVLLPPLYLGTPYFALIFLSGFLGADYPEACREWLARFRAWNLLFAGLWVLFAGAALLGPYAGSYLFQKGPVTAIAGYVVSHIAALVAGSSSKGDGKPSPASFFGLKPMDVIAWIASPLAILGILLACSTIIEKAGSQLEILSRQWTFLPAWLSAVLLLLFACLFVQATLGLRIDVNIFSMHAFYRNRLARCYLGATNPTRRPDPFTGFDNNDELMPSAAEIRAESTEGSIYQNRKPLYVRNLLPERWKPLPGHSLTTRENTRPYQGPFPIFCSTINLTFGQDLAWQERKGASFAFTPLYSGYHVGWTAARTQQHLRFNGYTDSWKYTGDRGVSLETAVAVSGAAMNPNQGYNTLPAVAFLMTLFNVRLGWWIWNPRHTREQERRWKLFPWIRITRPSPVCAMSSLVRELVGAVDDTSQFVLLTDGGHFENMGLYELVRRRCKFIVICDAEQDENMHFSGIGRAIRNCRIDFGAEIDLDLRPLQLQKDTAFSATHCVVGTIRYPPPATTAPGAASPDCRDNPTGDDGYCGVIVYIKASLVGDEPGDLLAYKNANQAFPQDPTSNQWFTESQFESYRRLGHHIGVSVLNPAMSCTSPCRADMKQLFNNLLQIWYPPTPEMQAHFSEHVQRYELILSELRTRSELQGLADVLFSANAAGMQLAWNAQSPAAAEYARQFANSLIDFMWMVYNNLQLAFSDNRTSPHATRWIEVFRRWSRVSLVRDAWTQYKTSYVDEFRLFAQNTLHIE